MAMNASLEERFRACMLLSAVGDAIGYRNGRWEFNYNGADIHAQAHQLGGVEKINVNPDGWRVSDDTIMHIATAKSILRVKDSTYNDTLWNVLCEEYVACWALMDGRGPGIQCAKAMPYLKKKEQIGYSPGGGGCGAAMRTMCLGLAIHKESDLKNLIAVSIEASRCTHNHPTGFLGGVVAALFTAYALQGVPLLTWGYKFVNEVYPLCLEYMQTSSPSLWEKYDNDTLSYFVDKWKYLLAERGLDVPDATEAKFPEGFETSVELRDKFYADRNFSFSGWAGSSGHDSVMLSYDALVGCKGDWIQFLYWGGLHGGDNDSTGAIGGAWFGALYGLKDIPECHLKHLEFKQDLESLASKLLEWSAK